MSSFLMSWPSLAVASAVSLAGQVLSFVTVNKAADFVVQGGINCFNDTMQYSHQELCDSLYDSYENWNISAKFALICAPVCLAATVFVIGHRCLRKCPQDQNGDEAERLVPIPPNSGSPLLGKVRSALSSDVAKVFYAGIGLVSFTYPFPGTYFLNDAAFEAGKRLAQGSSRGTTYIVLKSTVNTAIAVSQFSVYALGASFMYSQRAA